VNKFIRSIAVLLLSVCAVQGVRAQFNVSGPGFLPDENGTNLDDQQAKKGTPKGATVTVVKDCAECPEMVLIPAGSFVMGSMGSYRNRDEEPMHSVNLRSFLMGKTEVIQEQWEAVMGNNPSKNKGPTLPVENVSWDDVQQFIVKLNKKTGHRYRLPSEAEWEYAARAGTTTEWSHGNDESKLGDYAWYGMSNASKTQAVGQKLPTRLVCLICTATFLSGRRTVGTTTTLEHRRMAVLGLQVVANPSGCFVAALGAFPQGLCARPSASGKPQAIRATTMTASDSA